MLALVGAVLATGATAPVAATTPAPCWNITGTWQTIQGGNRTLEFTFDQSGHSVTGTATDGASLSGHFSGNVTGDHVDVIVTWNAKRADGSTLEGEYEATISNGTLTGTTHDVANPSSHATWTATGGPTKTCAGQPTPSESSTPGSLTDRGAEDALLKAASNGVIDLGNFSPQVLADGNKLVDDFRHEVSTLPQGFVSILTVAGGLAQQQSPGGATKYPSLVAMMPVILRMAFHAATEPDRADQQNFVRAALRLVALLVQQDTEAPAAGPA